MPRLVRPNPPLEVRCRVAMRQLGEMWPDKVIEAFRMKPGDPYLKGIGVRVPRLGLGKLLALKLDQLTELIGCSLEDLRLDHDPALENREKVFRRGVHVDYMPAANDPEHLFYRPHGTQFAGSHDVKTRIRGDHGQLSDNALAKKERRRLRKLKQKNVPRGKKLRGPKLRSANRWPPKGSRKIQNRGFR